MAAQPEAYGAPLRVTVAIRVAAQGNDPAALLAAADACLYAAKRSGKNAVRG